MKCIHHRESTRVGKVEMRNNIAYAMLSVLIVGMLLIFSIPASSAEAKTSATEKLVGQVSEIDNLNIIVIENSEAFKQYQIGSILITLTISDDRSGAVLNIEDLSTNVVSQILYDVSFVNDHYLIEVYSEESPLKSFTKDNNPFVPTTIEKTLLNSRNSGAIVNDKVTIKSITPGEPGGSSYYWWDGLYYVHSSLTVKYNHPYCSYYQISTWQTVQLTGNSLYAIHIDNSNSNTIANAGPVVGGALIGALIGGAPGAVVGAIAGLIIGNWSAAALLDETGCLWIWQGKNWAWVFTGPIPPYSILGFCWLPNYYRLATFTLWDNIGIGSP